MKVIAISGWKRSGKDTSAEYLIKDYGYIRYGFADSLKDLVAEQYGIPRSYCDDPNFKEKPLLDYPVDTSDAFAEVIHRTLIKEFRTFEGDNPYTDFDDWYELLSHKKPLFWTPRALCILEGSVKRSANNGFWVQKVIRDIKEQDARKAVISDLRYRSEVAQLREAFGDDLVTIRVNRFETSPSNDASERDLDKHEFDYTISNVGTVDDLQTELDIIMEKVCLT
jgi:hypothetical protein